MQPLKRITAFTIILSLSLTGCKKFLDEKSDQHLTIPSKIDDFQVVLDRTSLTTSFFNSLGEASADNYYMLEASWLALPTEADRNMYIWEKEIAFNEQINEWRGIYLSVMYINTILDRSAEFYNPADAGWRNVLGSALLIRAWDFYNVAQTWCVAYDAGTAATALGIPLRLDPDYNVPSTRSTLRETYERIIADAKASIDLLPVTPVHVMRPSKPAAYGFLARVYLAMRDYKNAALYADSCLQLNNNILNYNTLTATASYPVQKFNKEEIFHVTGGTNAISNTWALIDSTLYKSYATNDLRKTIFFRSNTDGTVSYKGSYDAANSAFRGLAVDEMYCIKAECEARNGAYQDAMTTLNTLLINRWKTGTFVPLTATNASDALGKVLTERRKELIMRDLRWMDIKRLNLEGANISITRKLGTKTYTLPANDNRFSIAIPQIVIDKSGMQQNPR